MGGCDPRPGKAGLSQGLAELVFGVSVPAAGAVWGELMPGSSCWGQGQSQGFVPGGSAGVAQVWCREEEEDGRKEGRQEGRSQGVAQVMLLPAAVGARMGWEVTCAPLEEIWGWSRTLNDG